MIDYDKIITELGEELLECNYRYSEIIPLRYQRELEKTITTLITCRGYLKEFEETKSFDTPNDLYKVKQLLKMLSHETSQTEAHYGARLHHDAGDTKVLTIDAGGLRALIAHYATNRTDLENYDCGEDPEK